MFADKLNNDYAQYVYIYIYILTIVWNEETCKKIMVLYCLPRPTWNASANGYTSALWVVHKKRCISKKKHGKLCIENQQCPKLFIVL